MASPRKVTRTRPVQPEAGAQPGTAGARRRGLESMADDLEWCMSQLAASTPRGRTILGRGPRGQRVLVADHAGAIGRLTRGLRLWEEPIARLSEREPWLASLLNEHAGRVRAGAHGYVDRGDVFRVIRPARAALRIIRAAIEGTAGALEKAKPEWVTARTASLESGLSADTIRVRARREEWPIGKAGKMNSYRLSDLEGAWPERRFLPDRAH